MNNNKVLVKLVVPEIDIVFDMYLPINRKIGNIINLISETVSDLTDNEFALSTNSLLYNSKNGQQYAADHLLLNTDIRNGTVLVLLSDS